MKSILAAVVLLFLILADKAHGAAAVPYQQLYPSDFQTNLFPLVKLNLDPTQFNTNLTEIHISETSIIGRQYWTNLGGNLFPVGFPFNTNRFLIKASTGFTGTGTNYFGDDGVFHPLNVTIGTNDLWASVGNVYFPAQQEDSLIATNINSALSLVALGAFTMPASLSSNLVTGENDLNAYQNGSIFLLGPTADPNDTTISLNAGSGTGQIIFIQNAQNNKGFSLTNNTPQWDASGTILLTMGDWKPTTAGQTLMLMQSQLGNWQEVGRFGGGVPSDGFWQYGVAAAGVLSPSIGSQVWATNLTGWNKLQAAGSFTTPAIHVYSVVGGSNQISMAQTSLINVNSQTNANAVVYLTAGDGDVGQHVWMFNTFTNTGFCLNTGVAVDNTNLIVLIRGDSWCPTQYGESIELVREPGGWVEINRADPHGNPPSTFTINPTDQNIPYRINATTFGDSPWINISTQYMGFAARPGGNTKAFIVSDYNLAVLGVGYGVLGSADISDFNTAVVSSEVAYGDQAGDNLLQGCCNAFIGSLAGGGITNGHANVIVGFAAASGQAEVHRSTQSSITAVGAQAGYKLAGGSENTLIGANTGATLTSGAQNTMVGTLSDATSATLANTVLIGYNARVTNSNEIVIGNVNNTKAIFPITSYGGTGTKFLSDDGTYKAGGGGGATINPTDAYVPVRANAATFDDSYLAKSGANEMYFTNSALKVDNDLTVNPRLQDPNTHGVVIHGDSSSHGTTIRDDHVVTGNNQQNRIGTSDAYNAYGFSADGTATATALNPQQFSENVDWIGTAYSTNAGVLRSVGMGSQLHTFGAANEPTGLLTFVSHINGVAVTNMTLSTASAWDGSGTHFLSDDGTFKTASGGTSYWQTNTGSASISPLNTGTGFYITDTGQIGAGFPTNIFHGKDIGIFRQVDTSPLGSTPVFINTGIANTWPSPIYFGEWWTKLETNDVVMDLTSSGSGGTFDHVWTSSHDNPSGFFYYQTVSNSVPTFQLDGQSGDLSIIKSVPYSWPTANAAGSLQNDGSGGLTWASSIWTNYTSPDMTNRGVIQPIVGTNDILAIGQNAYAQTVANDGVPSLAIRHTTDLGDDSRTFVEIGTSKAGDIYSIGSAFIADLDTNSCFGGFQVDGANGHGSYCYFRATQTGINTGTARLYIGSADNLNRISLSPTLDIGSSVVWANSMSSLTNGQYMFNFNTNSIYGNHLGMVGAIGGFSSTATDTAVSGTSAGWTNTFGKAAVIRFDGSALIYNVFNNALTSIYTNTVVVGQGTEIIQTGGKILFTSGSVSQWVAAPF